MISPLVVITIFVAFILGFWIGQYSGSEIGSSWNPFYMYGLLTTLENSPLTWVSGAMYEEAREMRRTLLGAGCMAAAGGAAYYWQGADAAMRTVKLGAKAWEGSNQTWKQWSRQYHSGRSMADELAGSTQRPLLMHAMDLGDSAFELYRNVSYAPPRDAWGDPENLWREYDPTVCRPPTRYYRAPSHYNYQDEEVVNPGYGRAPTWRNTTHGRAPGF